MKYLIVTADDLGTTHAMNEGIIRAKKGVLTSLSIRANGFAYDDAVKRVLPECKDIGIGVHLCLNEGCAVSRVGMLPELTDDNGQFKKTFIKGFLFLATQYRNKKIIKEVEVEIRNQIEKILGLPTPPLIDHLDGHNHIHMIPWVFEIVCKCASDYGIKWIRMVDEPFNIRSMNIRLPLFSSFVHHINLKRWSGVNKVTASKYGVRYNDVFLGVLHGGYMSADVSVSYLDCNIKDNAVTEILFHVGVINDQRDLNIDKLIMRYHNDEQRLVELATITSPVLRQKIEDNGLTLTSYRGLQV